MLIPTLLVITDVLLIPNYCKRFNHDADDELRENTSICLRNCTIVEQKEFLLVNIYCEGVIAVITIFFYFYFFKCQTLCKYGENT